MSNTIISILIHSILATSIVMLSRTFIISADIVIGIISIISFSITKRVAIIVTRIQS